MSTTFTKGVKTNKKKLLPGSDYVPVLIRFNYSSVIKGIILYYSNKTKQTCIKLFSVQIHEFKSHTFWMAEDRIGLTHVLYLNYQS